MNDQIAIHPLDKVGPRRAFLAPLLMALLVPIFGVAYGTYDHHDHGELLGAITYASFAAIALAAVTAIVAVASARSGAIAFGWRFTSLSLIGTLGLQTFVLAASSYWFAVHTIDGRSIKQNIAPLLILGFFGWVARSIVPVILAPLERDLRDTFERLYRDDLARPAAYFLALYLKLTPKLATA